MNKEIIRKQTKAEGMKLSGIISILLESTVTAMKFMTQQLYLEMVLPVPNRVVK